MEGIQLCNGRRWWWHEDDKVFRRQREFLLSKMLIFYNFSIFTSTLIVITNKWKKKLWFFLLLNVSYFIVLKCVRLSPLSLMMCEKIFYNNFSPHCIRHNHLQCNKKVASFQYSRFHSVPAHNDILLITFDSYINAGILSYSYNILLSIYTSSIM